MEMERPGIDVAFAKFLEQIERKRVGAFSDADGEPMQWAEADSLANAVSVFNARVLGGFKQWVADRVAGDFDEGSVGARLDAHVAGAPVAMLSFTTCPFCRKAKADLEALGMLEQVAVLELDLDEEGNALRALNGRRTGRTSVPAIFVGGEFIGGCNDGPGLGPLLARGELMPMLEAAGATFIRTE
jgi:glutaredoxin 3